MDPELGINIVDLGLVYESDAHAGVAHILMTTTSPACPIGLLILRTRSGWASWTCRAWSMSRPR